MIKSREKYFNKRLVNPLGVFFTVGLQVQQPGRTVRGTEIIIHNQSVETVGKPADIIVRCF